MNIIHALLLGLVEGITEFLPISSTGHMILLGKLIAIPQTDFLTSFEIIIQLGAIAAVIVLYARTLLSKRFLWKPLLCAFIPTAVIGFLLYKIVKQYLLGNPYIVVASLCVGGVAFLIIEQLVKRQPPKTTTLERISPTQAFIIGLGQTLSIIPGVSRSAASIFTGLIAGLSRELSVEFSFLLAIPTMVAAVGLDMVKTPFIVNSSTIIFLAVGIVTSFITALLAIKTFLRFVKNNSFLPFAIYRIVLAGIFYFFVLK